MCSNPSGFTVASCKQEMGKSLSCQCPSLLIQTNPWMQHQNSPQPYDPNYTSVSIRILSAKMLMVINPAVTTHHFLELLEGLLFGGWLGPSPSILRVVVPADERKASTIGQVENFNLKRSLAQSGPHSLVSFKKKKRMHIARPSETTRAAAEWAQQPTRLGRSGPDHLPPQMC